MTVLDAVEQVLTSVAETVGEHVVGVGPGWGRGSGFVVAEGRIVTNAHNLRGPEARVRFADGEEVTASLAAADLDGDLAVLTADTGARPALAWRSGDATIGLPVVALANAGGRGLRATLGLVSGTGRAFRGPRGRRNTGAVEHTAPMGRGSSGGPLLDAAGRLVGINTHRLGEGLYLAQPADEALRERIDALARGEAPRRPQLGVALAPDRAARRLRAAVGLPPRDGVLVHAVADGSPADRAGLQRGDLVVEAGPRELRAVEDLLDVLAEHPPGAALQLTILRGTEERTVTVAPDAEAAP